MALTTALRNVGVGLVIVTGSFAGTPAVTPALTYGILEVLGSLLVASREVIRIPFQLAMIG